MNDPAFRADQTVLVELLHVTLAVFLAEDAKE